jgi:hypothetical protein
MGNSNLLNGISLPNNPNTVPNKSCIITVMFEITDDINPTQIYEYIKKGTEDIKNKRLSCNIDER